jgi:hypothetical protein
VSNAFTDRDAGGALALVNGSENSKIAEKADLVASQLNSEVWPEGFGSCAKLRIEDG